MGVAHGDSPGAVTVRTSRLGIVAAAVLVLSWLQLLWVYTSWGWGMWGFFFGVPISLMLGVSAARLHRSTRLGRGFGVAVAVVAGLTMIGTAAAVVVFFAALTSGCGHGNCI